MLKSFENANFLFDTKSLQKLASKMLQIVDKNLAQVINIYNVEDY